MPAVVVAVVMWESASSISKGCGKGGKTVLSFSHAFHRPSFPRKDSVPVSMMWALSVIRSSSALQSRGFGNTVVHSENGKFVVTIMGLTQKLLLSESAGGGGAGLFVHARIILGQQPPKQPLAQNKNGRRFGCRVYY